MIYYCKILKAYKFKQSKSHDSNIFVNINLKIIVRKEHYKFNLSLQNLFWWCYSKNLDKFTFENKIYKFKIFISDFNDRKKVDTKIKIIYVQILK